MKFGFRTPSIKKSIAARFSLKKKFMPRGGKGFGFIRDPEKAIYNSIYNKTSASLLKEAIRKKTLTIKYTKQSEIYKITERDVLFEDVALFAISLNEISTSMIQRKFNLGYIRACLLIDNLTEAHVIRNEASPFRTVLINSKEELEKLIPKNNSSISK